MPYLPKPIEDIDNVGISIVMDKIYTPTSLLVGTGTTYIHIGPGKDGGVIRPAYESANGSRLIRFRPTIGDNMEVIVQTSTGLVESVLVHRRHKDFPKDIFDVEEVPVDDYLQNVGQIHAINSRSVDRTHPRTAPYLEDIE